jgi:signal transduction histidine kinase
MDLRRAAPVATVAVAGVGLTVADAFLRSDAASGLAGAEPLPELPTALVVALVLAQAAALWARSRRPMVVLFAVTAADAALLAISAGSLSVGAIAVVVAAYTVFRRRSGASVYPWFAAAALCSTAASWAFVAPADGPLSPGELPFALARAALLFALPALVGELVASRSRAMVALRERAELAERERERTARDAVAEQRASMARELHDIAAHHLTGIIVGAQAAGALVAAEPDRAREYIRTVARDAQLTLANLRQTVGLLRSDDRGDLAPAPAIAQLPRLVDELRDAGMSIRDQWVGETVPLGPVAESAAYRMVQESLANARQHAPGAACTLRVEYSDTGTRITVANERPETVPAAGGGGGHGMVGMRERAALTGSTLVAGPTRDGGWQNELTVPLPDPGRGGGETA